MPPMSLDWTVEMLEALPDDGNRYEIIDGELFVTPSPSYAHQRAVRFLAFRLDAFLRSTGAAAEVLFAPADVRMTNRTSVEPDVLVLPRPVSLRPDGFAELPSTLLAVEVISPSSARADRSAKRMLYQRAGVEYWIVDLDAELVERWMPDDQRPEILRDQLAWRREPAGAELSIPLPQLFAEARGD